MAKSYAHMWGELVGNLFQESIREALPRFSDRAQSLS